MANIKQIQPFGSTSYNISARYMYSPDTRSTAINPNDLSANENGIQFDFKQKSITGLSAAYSGIMSYRPYSQNSDWTGGPAHQLAFDENGLHWRKSTGDTTWQDWQDIVRNTGTWGISITGSSASCTGNAATATKLQTARTIWGQSFNGTANISGSFTGAGPQLYLPSGQTNFQFLTSGGGAGSGKFGRLLLSDNYSQGDISSYRLDVYGGSARIYNGLLYITANSNTVTIGSQNTSFCHITNSANIPFYFNKEVQSAVAFKIYDSSTRMSDGSVTIRSKSNPSGNSRGHGISLWEDGEGGNISIYTGNCGTYGSWQWDIDAFNGDLRFFSWDSSGNYHGTIVIDKSTGVLHGACWNDYAEFRETCQEAKPGQCVIENGDDTLSLSTKRCQPGAQIISDTYGFAIGEIEGKYETPLAVSGRVLAYTDVDRYKFKPGQAVCSGPNGTVSRMRWYEKILWPERMIGFVSAIPEYEEWGNINAEVKVNNRIWIKVR